MKFMEEEDIKNCWLPEGKLEVWSGRADLDCRPQRPERCALTRLRYAPNLCCFLASNMDVL